MFFSLKCLKKILRRGIVLNEVKAHDCWGTYKRGKEKSKNDPKRTGSENGYSVSKYQPMLGCNISDLTGAPFTEGDTFWDGHLKVTDVDLGDSGDCEVGFKFDTTGLSLEQLKSSLELIFKMQEETGVVIKDAKGIPFKDSCEIKRLFDLVAEQEKAKTNVED